MILDIMTALSRYLVSVLLLKIRFNLLLQSRSPEPPTSSLPVSLAERAFLVVACHP